MSEYGERIWRAYAAGFFDGEGSVGVYYYANKRTRPKVSISNTDLAVLEEFKARYGGSIHKQSKAELYYVQCYGWSMNGRYQIKKMLKDLLPYLRTKRLQADLMLEYLAKPPYQRRMDIIRELKEAKREGAESIGLPRTIPPIG